MKKKQHVPLRKAPRRGSIRALIESVADGDILQIPLSEVNVSSLRARAGDYNIAAGYSKYSVSKDALTGVVRLINNG